MEFDKSKVYTALNADELKVGSKVFVSDNLLGLINCIKSFNPYNEETIEQISSISHERRFITINDSGDDVSYSLAYLIEEPKAEEYRPYKDGNEAFMYLHDKWLIDKEDKSIFSITAFYDDCIIIYDESYSYDNLLNNFEIYSETGKNEPCGVKID